MGEKAQIKSLQQDMTVKEILVDNLQCDLETKELDMCMLNDELKASERRSSTLQEEVRDKELQLKALREDMGRLDRLKETFAQEAKEKTAALKEKASLVSTLSKQVQEKDKQIEKLKKRQIVRDESSLKQLKSENARFREHNMCLEVQVSDMAIRVAYLEDKGYQEAVYVETLEQEVAELRQVVLVQKRNIDRLERTADRRYKKLSQADQRDERLREMLDVIDDKGSDFATSEASRTVRCDPLVDPVEIHGSSFGPPPGNNASSSCTASEPSGSIGGVSGRGNPPELQPDSAPTATDDNTGMLGAALGVAVGVGIAGLAALLRR